MNQPEVTTTTSPVTVPVHGEGTGDDRGFVSGCLNERCPTIFADGERVCRLCGRHRAQRCWIVDLVGASEQDLQRIEGILDSTFNSDRFIGNLSGQITKVDGQGWGLKQMTIQRERGGANEDGTSLVVAAFRNSGYQLAFRK